MTNQTNSQPMQSLQQEWCILMQQTHSEEKISLLIKLVSLALCSLLVFHQQLDWLILGACAIAWFLDAIWKTFQRRTNERLEVVEHAILKQDCHQAMQFNTQWNIQRGGALALLTGYIRSALTPTVVAPHACILSMALAVKLIG